MTTALALALIVTHGGAMVLGAWAHYSFGHRLKHGPSISTNVPGPRR